jgi:hypothetical protein
MSNKILTIALAYLVIKKRKTRTRTKYVREILRRRTELGEFNLVKEMRDDAEYHFRYFRSVLKKNGFILIYDCNENRINLRTYFQNVKVKLPQNIGICRARVEAQI